MSKDHGYDYDFFCIGAGSGGVRASRIAATHGAKVAVCEESRIGGTCVMRGCVPKKLLVYATHYSTHFEDSEGFGWSTDTAPKIDWTKLIERKDAELDRLEGIYRGILSRAGVELIEGHGEFVDAHTVRVGDKTYTADKILICTGGWPWMPSIPGIEHVITSNEALDLKELPKHIVIVGGGYIACEFASIFNGAGSTVVQVYRRSPILRGFDADVRKHVQDAMIARGVNFRLDNDVSKITKRDAGGFAVELTSGDVIDTDVVFYATGRKPNLRINLDAVGVKTEHGAIVVDKYSRTNVENIYAVGDVTNRINLTPVALAEGHCVADTLYGGTERLVDHEFVASAVFTQPNVGTVGFSEEEAKEKFGEVDVYVSRFKPMKHTIAGREERVLMKLIVQQETQKVVGCHMVGDDAGELIQGLAICLKMGATKADFDRTIGIHPTAAEEWVTMRTKRAD